MHVLKLGKVVDKIAEHGVESVFAGASAYNEVLSAVVLYATPFL